MATTETHQPTAEQLIKILDLTPHPEGGFFRETYRAPQRDAQGRAASTAIYFLLPKGHVSKLHRIDADEAWHHYLGGPLEIYELDERRANAEAVITTLGSNIAAGETPQHVVPAGVWFGAAPAPGVDHVLVGCTVAPGFEFSKFELGDRTRLLTAFDKHSSLIHRLT